MEPKKPRGERRALTVQQLLAKEQQVQAKYQETKSEPVMADLYKDREEIGSRLSLPFACLAVAFAAAPLGARTRRAGRSFLFLAGALVVGGYYLLQMLLTPRALLPLPEVVLIAWIPNMILCAIGMLLTWRVDRV
jgi:lipopolysaccharide export LptBFGC system permease protein LptF